MNYLKKYLPFCIILVFLNGCGGGWSNFKKTISGEKVITTDEFLIKKKDPLVLPPEYEKLPAPNSKKKAKNKNSVESALGSSSKTTGSSENKSALENMILKKLSKRN